MNEEGNDINDHCFTTSLSVEGAPLEEAANGWETWEWERAASWTFSWAEPHRRPTKTFPGISVLFSFKMFVSERKRSAEDKIRRCLVSPLPCSLFIADHQIYHSFSFWWQSKQIYLLCYQNPICLNTLSLEGFYWVSWTFSIYRVEKYWLHFRLQPIAQLFGWFFKVYIFWTYSAKLIQYINIKNK